MSELLDLVLHAHGGLDRWRKFNRVRATIVAGGGLLPMKGLDVDPKPLEGTVHIVRQGSKIDVHEPEVYADSRAFLTDQHAGESIGRSNHPATAGRHCRSGARQSTPSISIDNCDIHAAISA